MAALPEASARPIRRPITSPYRESVPSQRGRRVAARDETESTRPDVDDSELVPAIVVDEAGGAVAELEALTERARAYARSSKAANTLRAYESDLRHFGAWCERRAREAFSGVADASRAQS
jgi:hypothetical protein